MNLGPTGLELTAMDLRKIADGLDGLKTSGVRVDHFVAHGYRVTVRHRDDQREGVWFVVTGIEREQW